MKAKAALSYELTMLGLIGFSITSFIPRFVSSSMLVVSKSLTIPTMYWRGNPFSYSICLIILVAFFPSIIGISTSIRMTWKSQPSSMYLVIYSTASLPCFANFLITFVCSSFIARKFIITIELSSQHRREILSRKRGFYTSGSGICVGIYNKLGYSCSSLINLASRLVLPSLY